MATTIVVTRKEVDMATSTTGAPRQDRWTSLRRTLLIAMIGSLSATALIGIITLLSGSFDEPQLRILGTTAASGVFSLTALAASVRFEKQQVIVLGAAGIGASALALVLAVVGIWNERSGDDLWRSFGTSAVLAAAFGYASLVLLITPRLPAVRLIVSGTLAAVTVVATMLIVLIFGENVDSDGFFRILGAVSIVAVFGTVVAPLVNRLAGDR